MGVTGATGGRQPEPGGPPAVAVVVASATAAAGRQNFTRIPPNAATWRFVDDAVPTSAIAAIAR